MRPLHVVVGLYRKVDAEQAPVECRVCGEGFAGQMHVADEFITRREFTKSLGLVSLAAFIATITEYSGRAERGGVMDDRHNRLGLSTPRRAGRQQQMSVIYAVMVCLAMLILLQTLMLNIAIEGHLGGVRKVIFPATLGSGLCFAGSCRLSAYLQHVGKSTQ